MTTKRGTYILGVILFAALALATEGYWKTFLIKKQLSELNVYFPIPKTFPEPANIQNTGQWYLLSHVSSGLAHFDHLKGRFEPLLSSFETFSSGVHSFTLNENARFHDGTPITAYDVVASIKRLVIRKTSTHFPLWDYLDGCSNIKSINEECPGIIAVSDRKIDLRLKKSYESFLLQMASPETGIWYKGDIDPVTLDLHPTKFSGPYFVEKTDERGFHLARNDRNPISQKFPNSPKTVLIRTLSSSKVRGEMESGGVDVVIRSHNPYSDSDFQKDGFRVFSSAPSTLIYLHGAGTKSRKLIPIRLLNALWKANKDPDIISADNFLPFDPSLSLSREDFLAALPEETKVSTPIRVGVPWTYLSRNFYEFIKNEATKVGVPIEIVELDRDEWSNAFEEKKSPKDVDFIMGLYAASERFPAVQLRYIAGSVRGPKIDLKEAETPELTIEKKAILKSFEQALLENQYAIPLFFSRHQITYRNNLDVGDQPPVDTEVELWRVVRR